MRILLTLAIVVVALWTTEAVNAKNKIDCKDGDDEKCNKSWDSDDDDDWHDDIDDASDRAEKWIWIVVGTFLGVVVLVVILIVSCMFCAFCPWYKRRQRGGRIFGAAQQPAVVYTYPQTPYSPTQPPPYPTQQGVGPIYTPDGNYEYQQQQQQQQQPQLHQQQPPQQHQQQQYPKDEPYYCIPNGFAEGNPPTAPPPAYESHPPYQNTTIPIPQK